MPLSRALPIVGTLALVLASPAHAWGPIGHRLIAETAALLVKASPTHTRWGELLGRHRFEIGYYSTVPDLVFRNRYTETEERYRSPEFGPSRVNQYAQRANGLLKDLKNVGGTYQRGAVAKDDPRKIFLGMLELGMISHYASEATQPLNADVKNPKYAAASAYFETECVSALDPELARPVLDRALRLESEGWLSKLTPEDGPSALTRAVFRESSGKVEALLKIDRKNALISPSNAGAPAKRRPAASGCVGFRDLLVEQLAKGAVLSARLWERVLPPTPMFEGSKTLQFSDMILEYDYPAPPADTQPSPAPAR